jgi:hypothetical protein
MENSSAVKKLTVLFSRKFVTLLKNLSAQNAEPKTQHAKNNQIRTNPNEPS